MESVPYLASLSWYSAWAMARLGLCDAPQLPQNSNRALIRGAWGEQTLSVPIEGGRRRLACVPYDRLRLSEHGNWRHAHWQSLVSAYGAFPYFHYFEDEFAAVYAAPADTLASLCRQLHTALVRAAGLEEALGWLRDTGSGLPQGVPVYDMPRNVAAIELLFMRGPETVYTLLGPC